MQRELFARAVARMGDVERAAIARGDRFIIGVDEAGRGPLAGPVYAAAVLLDMARLEQPWIAALNDSKKLTEAAREALFDPIKQGAIAWAIASRDSDVIDRINILEATREAMAQAVLAVAAASPEPIDRVYIDGKQFLDITLAQSCVIQGDGRSAHIAAASILAKVARDRALVEAHKRWPEYGFAKHKGYGTRAHRDAIAAHGPCPLHRLTFGGVREHVARLRAAP